MTDRLAVVLPHLDALVSFDTRNPPRAIATRGIFDYLRAQLPDFECQVVDHGAGAVSMLAVRGAPRRVFNVHLDTVPSSPAWSADPLRLRICDDRAIGLGACDIKGAAACMLAAAQSTQGDAALLFTTDEEANDARCISAFLETHHGFAEAVIAEPTCCTAVLAHRGISSVEMEFHGTAGHASSAQGLEASALHQAVRWAGRALDEVETQAHARFGGLTGLRFNIGRIEGGIKANMIAPHALVRFGFRPLPSQSIDAVHDRWRSFATNAASMSYRETFRGPALPAGSGSDAEEARLKARDLADALGLPTGNAVDFWTEAALFSAAGLTAFVFGPGDIAQAHSADEWVALDQLAAAADHYTRLFGASP